MVDGGLSSSGCCSVTSVATSGKRKKAARSSILEPIEAGKSNNNKKSFSKRDLVEAVRRLTPGGSLTTMSAAAASEDHGNSFDVTSATALWRRQASSKGGTQLALMEWGVNTNARKLNELRTQADRKAAALKSRLDDLRSLKLEQEALQKMGSAEAPQAVRVDELLRSIDTASDEIDRRLHYRRQLEQMLRRLQKNQVAITNHVNALEDAYAMAHRERAEMRTLLRRVETGQTSAALKLAEVQRLYAIERDERNRTLEQRKLESAQAARMDAWRRKRELDRLEFASELRGDMSFEEEAKLQKTLTTQRRALLDLRAQHEVLQKEASALETAFAAVRQATGANSLDEVVDKFQSQEGNRKTLVAEKRDAEERLANAKKAKDDLDARFAELQNTSVGNTEMSRDIAEQLQREIVASRVELKVANATCERLEAVLVALRQGVVGLFQRLRPFGHLLEGEGSLPTAAMLPGTQPSSFGSGDPPAIDPIDAIHLSEIMLSKMVEVVGGDNGARDAASRGGNKTDDDDRDADDDLPNPENNVRVPTATRKLQTEALSYVSRAVADGAPDGDANPRYDASTNAADDPAEEMANLVDSSVEGLEDMVPNRSFLKLSSTRQHSEMLRRLEQDARKRRMMERIELVEEIDRAAMSSRAARKKAQNEATDRLSASPSAPTASFKESAIERSVDILNRTPDLE